ncbi:2,3-diaminopropionate biosynthesis protein SbnA [Streptomyces sp. NBC_00582]|uniref:2,3-diaminopropionate biosynthesis protein SbnA n=1 Tax=Streptomyces sp. NBC_00582 TaxID=2975783 RepID=UPI002E8002FD|nr:2,3-diaminopropionate biosynthesis protein SbnA [Streptomyces sp. NBC_00582]WUB63928.1 2,3-diaminopropionate biosynthesis protein SbnA [Streptomyces sp. NBC_00582]
MSAHADPGRIDRQLLDRVDALLGDLPRTRVVRLPHPGIRLYAKMESENRTGSAKDRAAIWILREAVRRGEITRSTTVVESSSGNFALALASFLHELDVPFVPVLDPNVNAATERTLRRLCARVEKVTEPDGTGGYLMSRLARVAELRARLPDVYWPNQYTNPDGARGHYDLTARELLDDLGRIDYLFVGVGTGATINGLSRRLGEEHPDAAVVAVDVEGSAIFGAPPARRRIPGIGSSIRPPLIDDAWIRKVVVLSERDEVAGCRALLRDHGIYAGGSTGCVYAAITRHFDGHTGPEPVVAFLCADSGTPYADTVYADDWVAHHLTPVATEGA